MHKFTATIAILGVNPYVRPPEDILQAIFTESGKHTSPITVHGKLNGAEFQQTLVRYQGDWRLYINGVMAKKAKLEFTGSVVNIEGQTVTIEVEFDPHPPVYEMPPEFAQALEADPIAKAAFYNMPPSHQKEDIRYLASMKHPDSLARNITKVLKQLHDKGNP